MPSTSTLPPNAMRGTWTVALYHRPQGAGRSATKTFLVEDFVPDRIEFDLTVDQRRSIGRRSLGQVDRRRPLPLWRARPPAWRWKAMSTSSTTRDWARASRATSSASPTRTGVRRRAAPRSNACRCSTTTARRPSTSTIAGCPSTTQLLDAKIAVRMRETGGRAVERNARRCRSRRATTHDRHQARISPATHAGRRHGQASPVIALDAERQAPGDDRLDLEAGAASSASTSGTAHGNSWNYEPITFTKAGRRPARST